ncbi:MAG: hypothetical protein ONB48_01120 [candidate division KSB1 bacterium]|nr:hypothetical protein [candidate division KSB1 bacterium]MDZ7272719.1 hypothetical protein [candidate division KSB1 bacterium]MDZ7284255.1 hypothetical protein [candidate division KSB1 bacterium]MDZ7297346.1 hypothetical protein [candidate division KSB1 bacterium]MDZ7307055.1 hypothetical protein [candidate division KSB1 bacterium]
MIRKFFAVSVAVVSLILAGPVSAQQILIEQLRSFQPFLDKTWKGEFKNSTREKPMFDVARWGRALNGTAVRSLHSVNNGEYGGEAIIFWDKGKQSLVFFTSPPRDFTPSAHCLAKTASSSVTNM